MAQSASPTQYERWGLADREQELESVYGHLQDFVPGHEHVRQVINGLDARVRDDLGIFLYTVGGTR